VSLRARDVVAAALAAADGPVTRARLIERTRLSAATVTRALLDLEAEGLARRVPGQKWQPADLPPGGDAP
jgi:DNA-binding IclR family transcriptional regulator